MERMRVAVVGVGNLGRHHARIYAGLPGVELVGVVDIDDRAAYKIARKFGTTPYRSLGEIPGTLDRGTAGRPELGAELDRHDPREGGLAETGRTMEEHVIERLAPLPRGADEDVKILAQPRLPDHLVEILRAQRLLRAALLGIDRNISD